jgi:acyl carrier protein
VTHSWEPDFEAALREVATDLPADVVIDPDADLFGYGIGSIQLVTLVISLEEVYDVEFPVELMSFAALPSAGAVWATVQSLLGETSPAGRAP